MLSRGIKRLIQQHDLPESYAATVQHYFLPLADSVAKTIDVGRTQPFVLGIQGAQGSGKSTCAEFLKLILAQQHQLRCLVLCMDDFYLTRQQREQLASDIHPLFATRGVPGTHDVALAITTFNALMQPGLVEPVSIPRFDKALDDRVDQSMWSQQVGAVDVIIFEGWCVALDPQPELALSEAINELESIADEQGVWRTYVNDRLATDYKEWFAYIDYLLVLAVPSFESVYDWRLLQEQKLIERVADTADENRLRIMKPDEIMRFISHYERLTRHALNTLPKKAKWLLKIQANHKISAMVEN